MYRLICLILPLSLALPTLAAQPPEVVLSARHQKLTKVKVGDALPALQLSAADGKPVAVKERYGKQATVVAVVGEPYWATRQLLADLPRDVTAAYGERGVTAVVMATGEKAKLPSDTEGFTPLADPDGQQFSKLGNGRLPRVYVLDGQGKIVWFDIEYSQSTRRELKQALDAMAGSR